MDRFQNQDHSHYLSLADDASRNGNCVRRQVGAVILPKQGDWLSACNGVNERFSDCVAAGCPRCTENVMTGIGYERCICIHAEEAVIAKAAKIGQPTFGALLYTNLRPCVSCVKLALAAGISGIHYRGEWKYDEKVELAYQRLIVELNQFVHHP